MINEYFTLLASLEYNMQEMYRVQKLANDLVDITVTVKHSFSGSRPLCRALIG